jgi:hypothetical protein
MIATTMRPLEPGINTVWRQSGMGNYTIEASPQAYARIGGVLYTITTTKPPRSYRLRCSVTPAQQVCLSLCQ